MKTRVISAMVGLAILAAVLALIATRAFNVCIAALSAIALFEMLRATGCMQNKKLAALSLAMSLIIPFAREHLVRAFPAQIVFVFFVLFFVVLIKDSATIKVEQIAMAFMFGIFIPLFFSCAVFMRDAYGAAGGGFYLLFALGSAWLCDTGAYFVGRKFGRRKLAPVVSPNKTVEGSIGGLLICTALMLPLMWGFSAVTGILGYTVKIDYVMLALATPVCAVMGMLGDLSASVIKRQFNVKDYGTIMPGHGGVMDRFDSVMFTLPTAFIISYYMRLITVL